MFYCPNCGQSLEDGKTFCRFCGERQPGIQLVNRLRSEAMRLKQGNSTNPSSSSKNEVQQETMSTLARLEQMRRDADEAARRRAGR